jgi:hypothetical protein
MVELFAFINQYMLSTIHYMLLATTDNMEELFFHLNKVMQKIELHAVLFKL